MRLFNDATEYALRATVWLAHQPPGPYKHQTIADATRAAPGYLIKVLQALAKAGIVSAQRGSAGGFTLDRDPGTLSVLEVISAIDPIERIRSCPLDLPEHAASLCPLHQRMDESLASLERDFARTTIAELAQHGAFPTNVCNALSSCCKPGSGRDLP